MKLKSLLVVAAFVVLCACAPSKPANLGYDPAANPMQQVEAAQREAAASGRRVLLIAGGDWCRWCHVLDGFLDDNKDVKAAMGASFVVVKVYTGDDNPNDAFFARFGEVEGYPHLWVLDRSGRATSIDTSPLEKGDADYDKYKFLAMLREASR